jgi:plastocyanin
MRGLCLMAGLSALSATLVEGATLSGRVTTPDGKPIADAVVFVQDAGSPAAAVAARSATLDQVDKTFVPGLLPIVVGTKVRFPNHDQIQHHVYSFSRTKTFELPLYKGEDAAPVLFDKVGVVRVGCNIHDWMSAIILVLPTPWFAKTGPDGTFTIENVPEGKQSVVAWHELSKLKLEETEQTVLGDSLALRYTLPLGTARPRPAMHGTRREP